MTLNAELLVLGGGPAGAAAALAFRALVAEARVVMLTAAPTKRAWRGGETLAAPARQLLHDLGCWEAFARAGFAECHGTMSAWGAEKPYENDFLFGLHGSGWHLDRRRFDGLLLEQARAANIEIHEAERVTESAQMEDGRWRVNDERSAGFVIDATGRSVAFAVEHGAHRQAADALVAVSCVYESASSIPLVEAAPDGWWYSGNGVAAYFSDADLVRDAFLHEAGSWRQRLAESPLTASRLAGARFVEGPQVCAAQTQRLNIVGGPGWAAAGDAAMTVDPLSSQGVLHALSSGRFAAFAAFDFLRKGKDSTAKYEWLTAAAYSAYDQSRREFYTKETRWAERPFWRRRALA